MNGNTVTPANDGSTKNWRVIMPTTKVENNTLEASTNSTNNENSNNFPGTARKINSPNSVYNYILEKGISNANFK